MVNSSGEPAHIKEALSRLVVELIKREWPQNCGSLLPELNNICGFGVHFTINMKLIYSSCSANMTSRLVNGAFDWLRT